MSFLDLIPELLKSKDELGALTDAFAAAVFAWALFRGYKYTQVDENGQEQTISFSAVKPLKPTWRSSSPYSYEFDFELERNGEAEKLQLVVTKVGGSSVLVNATYPSADGEKVSGSKFQINDIVSKDAKEANSFEDLYRKDYDGFVSKLDALIGVAPKIKATAPNNYSSKLQESRSVLCEPKSIEQKLVDARDTERTQVTGGTTSITGEQRDPNLPPGFEDEYELAGTRPARPYSSNPLSIGRDDVGPPFGTRPPMQPFIGGPYPSHPNGGMHPNLFDNTRDPEQDPYTRPPGARFDPTGPLGSGFGSGSGSGFGGGFI